MESRQAFLDVHGDTLRTADVARNITTGTEPSQTIVERPGSREGSQLISSRASFQVQTLPLGGQIVAACFLSCRREGEKSSGSEPWDYRYLFGTSFLKNLIFVYVCVVNAYAYVHVWCLCMHMQRSEVDIRCLYCSPPYFFFCFETDSLLNLELTCLS